MPTESIPLLRSATAADAAAVAQVYVSSWRSTYRGIIPADVLRGLDQVRETIHWRRTLATGARAFVACSAGSVVGFISFGHARGTSGKGPGNVLNGPDMARRRRSAWRSDDVPTMLGQEALLEPCGEIFTIYLLDEFKRRGLGRRLMALAAEQMLADGFASACVWVLRDNPARRFYERIDGQLGTAKSVSVGGAPLQVVSYHWPALQQLENAAANLADMALPPWAHWSAPDA